MLHPCKREKRPCQNRVRTLNQLASPTATVNTLPQARWAVRGILWAQKKLLTKKTLRMHGLGVLPHFYSLLAFSHFAMSNSGKKKPISFFAVSTASANRIKNVRKKEH